MGRICDFIEAHRASKEFLFHYNCYFLVLFNFYCPVGMVFLDLRLYFLEYISLQSLQIMLTIIQISVLLKLFFFFYVLLMQV